MALPLPTMDGAAGRRDRDPPARVGTVLVSMVVDRSGRVHAVGDAVELGRLPEDGSMRGADGANEVLAAADRAGARYLAAVTGSVEPVAVAERVASDLAARCPAAGLALHTWRADRSNQTVTVVTARADALVEVGGFDPRYPGLGWIDVADRLAAAGWALDGLTASDLPFVPALEPDLDAAARTVSEGRWYRWRTRDRAGRLRFHRYRARAAIAAVRSPGDRRRSLADAVAGWPGPRPHETQRGTGRRADWRFLLPPGSRRLTVIIDQAPDDTWDWLVADGWTDRVVAELPGPGDDPADVVVIGPGSGAMPRPSIEQALGALTADGAICIAVAGPATAGPRAALPRPLRPAAAGPGSRRVAEAARRAGAVEVRRYLALPNARRPSRLVPLDGPGGLRWLVGPRPTAAVVHRSAVRALVHGALGVARPVLAAVVGDVLVVAFRSRRSTADDGPPAAGLGGGAVVITSGFDEGSRGVVLPVDASGVPSAVVKVTARPAYRANADREHELLGRLGSNVVPAGLVPRPIERITVGGIHAVVESYGGRWTASEVLDRQRTLRSRAAVLDQLHRAVVALGRADARRHRWGPERFEDLIARWFHRLDETLGSSLLRGSLWRALRERSDALEGRELPFGIRHFDLGPWNVVIADEASEGPWPVTIVDWELGSTRPEADGPLGADLLYLTKYWLHIAQGCASVEDEQDAFAFLTPAGRNDPRTVARAALVQSARALDLDPAFLPLLEAHVWAEAACATIDRRRRRGRARDGGSPVRYLATVARHRAALLAAWPLAPPDDPAR